MLLLWHHAAPTTTPRPHLKDWTLLWQAKQRQPGSSSAGCMLRHMTGSLLFWGDALAWKEPEGTPEALIPT